MQRDGETTPNLDYFGARYYSGEQGRFLSADAPLVDQDLADPQSWNLYSYGRNNPLTNTDPTGQACVYGGAGDLNDQNNYTNDNSGGQSCAEAFGSSTPASTTTSASVPYQFGEQAFVGFYNLVFNGQLSGVSDLAQGLVTLHPSNLPFTLLGHSGSLLAAINIKGKSVQDLLQTANKSGRGGALTRVGHSLQKHSGRVGSQYNPVTGPESAWNQAGEELLNKILNDPQKIVVDNYSPRAGNVVDVIASDGKAARFSADMERFIGFIEK